MTQAAQADPGDGMTQVGLASDHAKQALLGAGVQNVYFGERDQGAEPAISLAPPFGLRDDRLPMRGRDVLLEELNSPDPTARVHLLHGLGGCGKTRLALEVANHAELDGTETWWVPATEESGFLAAMRSLGRRLGVTDDELRHGDAADVIWQRLLARAEPWLLVIDNADEPAILAGAGSSAAEGRGWVRRLPTGSPGRVLITSREGNADTWGSWCRRHRLSMLADDPAASMLADYSGHHTSLGDDEDARRLAARLGGLPLALKIAGSYLAQSASIPAAFADPGTIGTYREYLAAIDTGVAPTGQLTPDQALTLIGQTWELTLNRLDARRLPEARQLLRLLACFADAPVPYELLLHPATLARSTEFAGITGVRLWQALAALDDCGLIDLTQPTRPEDIAVLRLHPLVRDTSRPSASLPLLAIAAGLLDRATAAPKTGIPEDPPAWPIWRLLAPHAHHVFATLSALPGCPDDVAKAASEAAYLATRYMVGRGLYAAAETEYRDVLTARRRILGPDHPDTLVIRHLIAHVMAEQGNLAAAETEFRDILATRLRILGPEHPDTLSNRHLIAYVTAAQGNHAAAETEYRDILTARLRVLGPDGRNTLTTRHNIASAMVAQGKHTAAETEFRDVLASRLRVFGPDDPDTLITRQSIAYVMAEQGNLAAAEAEFRDILSIQSRVLGPEHPDTKRAARWVEALEQRRAEDSDIAP